MSVLNASRRVMRATENQWPKIAARLLMKLPGEKARITMVVTAAGETSWSREAVLDGNGRTACRLDYGWALRGHARRVVSGNTYGGSMTCIVALTDGKKVCMGADSAGAGGSYVTVRADPKIYRVGPFLIGFTSSFRMGQPLGHNLTVASRPEGTDVFVFMCTFVEAVRACFKDTDGCIKQCALDQAA